MQDLMKVEETVSSGPGNRMRFIFFSTKSQPTLKPCLVALQTMESREMA